MKTVTLSGLPYHAYSPSLYRHLHSPVTLAYDGQSWRIAIRDTYGPRGFASREEATTLIAQTFAQATREYVG